jgi:hypothetical protein
MNEQANTNEEAKEGYPSASSVLSRTKCVDVFGLPEDSGIAGDGEQRICTHSSEHRTGQRTCRICHKRYMRRWRKLRSQEFKRLRKLEGEAHG